MPELESLVASALAEIRTSHRELQEAVIAMRKANHPKINSTLGAIYGTGMFTLADLGGWMGMTREAVRLRIAAGDPENYVRRRVLSGSERKELRRLHGAADGRNPALASQVAEYRDYLQKLVSEDVSQTEIAAVIGVTRAAVAQQLRFREAGACGRWPAKVTP